MQRVERDEILDYVTYTEKRDDLRTSALAAKRLRRYELGEHLCFLFENRETIRYQVQEMMRTERIVREVDIQHELDTYNELLGEDGDLGCTLLISVQGEEERARLLKAWLGLNETLYVRLEDGTTVPPTWDPRQVGDDRLSAVQYLRFQVKGGVPVAIGCLFDSISLRGELELSPEQIAALRTDQQGN